MPRRSGAFRPIKSARARPPALQSTARLETGHYVCRVCAGRDSIHELVVIIKCPLSLSFSINSSLCLSVCLSVGFDCRSDRDSIVRVVRDCDWFDLARASVAE